MNRNMILSVSALGLLTGISANKAKAETYMCEPCPAGYYCSKGVKNTCPSDSLCTNGKKIAKSSCTKKQLYKYTSATSSNQILQAGIYEVELAGGGGGGGGAFGWSNWGCHWHGGGKGGNGEKTTTQFYLSEARLLNYTVGGGGSGGGGGGKKGGSGGTSTIRITNVVNTSASGGYGGYGANKSNGGSDGSNGGNGQGANGGSGGSGHNSCGGKSGSGGATGWITVYQWIC